MSKTRCSKCDRRHRTNICVNRQQTFSGTCTRMPNSASVRLLSRQIASCCFSYTVSFMAMSVCCSNHTWNAARCPVPPEFRMPAICPFPTSAVLRDLTDQYLLLLSCGIFRPLVLPYHMPMQTSIESLLSRLML